MMSFSSSSSLWIYPTWEPYGGRWNAAVCWPLRYVCLLQRFLEEGNIKQWSTTLLPPSPTYTSYLTRRVKSKHIYVHTTRNGEQRAATGLPLLSSCSTNCAWIEVCPLFQERRLTTKGWRHLYSTFSTVQGRVDTSESVSKTCMYNIWILKTLKLGSTYVQNANSRTSASIYLCSIHETCASLEEEDDEWI